MFLSAIVRLILSCNTLTIGGTNSSVGCHQTIGGEDQDEVIKGPPVKPQTNKSNVENVMEISKGAEASVDVTSHLVLTKFVSSARHTFIDVPTSPSIKTSFPYTFFYYQQFHTNFFVHKVKMHISVYQAPPADLTVHLRTVGVG